ncbi:MAG: response regulator transcription factor [Alkalibacterium sp.]|nr:response regulator transcription factor [Alkalibacterium sp.]TVP89796.1 MAG: DNA-binding response regulator [Alkalibacterium sp.]
MNNIRVVLIDDHTIVRTGIKSLLEKDSRFSVVGEGSLLCDGLEIVRSVKPDVVLLDFRLPDGDGVIGTKRIKAMDPAIKVLILTAYQSDKILNELLQVGADGFLLKTIEISRIIDGIIKVSRGESCLDESAGDMLYSKMRGKHTKHSRNPFNLTLREKEIMEYLVNGSSNKEIAYELAIAEKTVRNNLTKIMEKMNATNRTEAALIWERQLKL